MGNNCCVPAFYSSNKALGKFGKYQSDTQDILSPIPHLSTSPSSQYIQHISEREPEDGEQDPSNNPLTETIFLARSRGDSKKGRHRKSCHGNFSESSDSAYGGSGNGPIHKKFSSCSTILIDDSTVCQPNLKNTIKAVSLAVYYHIKNRESSRVLSIFDERRHALCRDPLPPDCILQDPEHKQIYRFIRTLFSAAQLTAECAVVMLVYLERLLVYAELDLTPVSWRRVVLGSILLASKVWDDQAVWNIDYCQILKDISVDDMNELERAYLELLQFNTNVPSSVYAKYYFDLRALVDAGGLGLPLEPLSREKAIQLEAMCSVCGEKAKDTFRWKRKRSNSLDGHLYRSPSSRMIIS